MSTATDSVNAFTDEGLESFLASRTEPAWVS
jgi:hypothetical protein